MADPMDTKARELLAEIDVIPLGRHGEEQIAALIRFAREQRAEALREAAVHIARLKGAKAAQHHIVHYLVSEAACLTQPAPNDESVVYRAGTVPPMVRVALEDLRAALRYVLDYRPDDEDDLRGIGARNRGDVYGYDRMMDAAFGQPAADRGEDGADRGENRPNAAAQQIAQPNGDGGGLGSAACKGSYALGTGCGTCAACEAEREAGALVVSPTGSNNDSNKPATPRDGGAGDEVAALRAEIERLRAIVREIDPPMVLPSETWRCVDCGPEPKIDEDGCCYHCGREAVVEPKRAAQPAPVTYRAGTVPPRIAVGMVLRAPSGSCHAVLAANSVAVKTTGYVQRWIHDVCAWSLVYDWTEPGTPGRDAMLTMLRGIADGSWEDAHGRPIPANVAREALRIVSEAWGDTREVARLDAEDACFLCGKVHQRAARHADMPAQPEGAGERCATCHGMREVEDGDHILHDCPSCAATGAKGGE